MARLPGARLLQGQALPRGWCGRRVGRGNRRVGGVAWRGWVGQGVGVAGGWARVSGGRGGAGCGWGGCSPSESCWPLPFLHAGRGCPAAGLASQASPRHPPPWPLPTNYLGGGALIPPYLLGFIPEPQPDSCALAATPSSQDEAQTQLAGQIHPVIFTCPSLSWLWPLQETQTKPEGQIHFFPIIFESKRLLEVLAERCGPSSTTKLPPGPGK